MWKLLDRADVVVGHNADKFDVRKGNARFIAHGLPPPPPYRTHGRHAQVGTATLRLLLQGRAARFCPHICPHGLETFYLRAASC
jgi:hypothetical protein